MITKEYISNDIGSKVAIQKFAESCGAIVHITKLNSQFRCNGSNGYLNWLDNTLQIKETANIRLIAKDYDFQIFSDPNQLFEAIKEKNKINNKARVVAGYCWDWNSKKIPSDYDIILPEFHFKKRWNLNTDKNLWIIGDKSIEEIGCIHTCQGLELDYVGVIIGPDMRYENGQIITDVTQRSSNDQSVKGFKSLIAYNRSKALQDADEIIKNTYRTLLTRGMKGCYVYCCDKSLAKYLAAQLEPQHESIPKLRIEPEINDEVKYIDFLPLYSIRAACGYFGEGELVDESGWMKVESMGKLNRICLSYKLWDILWNHSFMMETIVYLEQIQQVADKEKLYLLNTTTIMILIMLEVILLKYILVRNLSMKKEIGLMRKFFSCPKILFILL